MTRFWKTIAAWMLCLPLWGMPAPRPTSSVTLAWDPVTNPSTAIVRIYYGAQSGKYTGFFSVPATQSEFTVTGLGLNSDWFFAATAVDSQGLESGYSDEVEYKTPGAPVERIPEPILNFRKKEL